MDRNTLKYIKIIHPPTLFFGWTEKQFIDWLKIDEYGNKSGYNEKHLRCVLLELFKFPELSHFSDICLNILKDEFSYRTRD